MVVSVYIKILPLFVPYFCKFTTYGERGNIYGAVANNLSKVMIVIEVKYTAVVLLS
jgi:hypothetical protein